MGYQSIDANQATRLINDGAALLDVRSDAEFKSGHIANAINIPVSQLKSKLEKLSFAKDEPLVVYCQSGGRSARACAMLAKAGYKQVYNLGGGLMAWQSAGMPVTKVGGKKKSKKS